MKTKETSSTQLAFLAICISLGLVCKRVIAPLAGVITDFIRLPGGNITSAFSIMFLVIGVMFIEWKAAASFAGFIQALIALSLGMSANQGLFALVTFTVPGIVIDLMRIILKERNRSYILLACAAANTVCAFVSNLVVFHFTGELLVLWMLVAACFGVLAGILGVTIYRRICRMPDFVQMRKEIQ